MVSSDMFDWSEDELTNIIWGETGESCDQSIPFLESKEGYNNKKEWGQDSSSKNSAEQKSPAPETDLYIANFDRSSSFDGCDGSSTPLHVELWPDLSLTNDSKPDVESTVTAKVDKASAIFQNPNSGKEEERFPEYQWDGSFDDLDQILSNDDMIFGNGSIGNAHEIWSSSKAIASSPKLDLGGFRDTSENFEIKEEYLNEDEHDFTLGFDKDIDLMSESLKTGPPLSDYQTCSELEQNTKKNQRENTSSRQDIQGGENTIQKPYSDKGHKQNKLLKDSKNFDEKSFHQENSSNWSSSGVSRYPFPRVKLSLSPLMEQIQPPESLLYQQINNQYVPPAYGNISNPYTSVPMIPQMQSSDNQPMIFGYQIPMEKEKSIHKTKDSSVKYQTLTPQEKIEKLRKRQQMQAMLAVQKQQQQFGHDFPCSDPSYSSQENTARHGNPASVHTEDLSNLPKFDSCSPDEQDDINTFSMVMNECPAEDEILYNLQEVVAKLDVRVRLCIRDSLYRLAQSATQRHISNDSSSTNNCVKEDRATSKDGNNCRNEKMPEMETESNPIDRTVAHLLFHRPMEFSNKRPNTPDSPASTKFQSDHKIAKSPLVFSPRSTKERPCFPVEGSQCSSLLSETQPFDQGKTGFCLDISENLSNTAAADNDAMDVNTSHQKEDLCIGI